MKIKVLNDYKVYKKGKEYALNNFTVLSGKNGSGKTNFLRMLAFHNDTVKIDNKNSSDLKVEYYSHYDFTHIPNNTRNSIQGYSDIYLNTTWKAYQKYVSDEVKDDSLISKFKHILDDTGKNIEDLDENDFKKHPISRSNEELRLFSYQFFEDTSLFLTHLNRNKYNHFLNVEYGEKNIVFSQQEFGEKYGNPPWETLNNVLSTVGSKYRFTQPINLDGRHSIEFKLFDTIHEVELHVKDLSDGEKTILNIICSIYDLSVANTIPDIFLFDEIDALLHPTYSRQIISILNEYLVEKLNKKVILVTHSPSTVAIAPQESIYLCQRDNFEIKKVSKDVAIANLTENLNSLSVLHENRRQIFTEDKDDAYFYEFIYKKLKTYLHAEITLNFIPVSTARAEKSGGSDKVKSIVKELSSFGNKHVFGIIDRDINNQTKDYLFVSGTRYSIENYIFDPIFLLAYFLREKIIHFKALGLKEELKYHALSTLPNSKLQELVDAFLKAIDLEKYIGCESRIEYVNGRKLTVSSNLLENQGHSLEKNLLEKHPKLKGRIRIHKSFKHAIILEVIDELPGFISKDFLHLFKGIQEK